MMNKEVKQLWVDALRSGEYEQGTGTLKNYDEFCCLGVLCDLHSKQDEKSKGWIGKKKQGFETYLKSSAGLPSKVLEWSNLSSRLGDIVSIREVALHLSTHNDRNRTFLEIADAIEAQL